MAETIEITVTTGSTEGSPISGNVSVGRGIMQNAKIRFSAGCNGAVKARIFNGANQLWPRTSGGFYRLVITPVEIYDMEPLTASSSTIYLKGWADGASYQHRIRLEFDVIPFDKPELIL